MQSIAWAVNITPVTNGSKSNSSYNSDPIDVHLIVNCWHEGKRAIAFSLCSLHFYVDLGKYGWD